MKNKFLIIIYIIILSVIAIGLLAFMFMGWKGNLKFWDLESNKQIVNVKEFNSEEVKEINFDGKSYDVLVRGGISSQVKVEVSGTEKSKNDIDITLDNGVLKVKQVDSTVCFGFCFAENSVVIYLPSNYQEKMKLKSISGDVDVMLNVQDLDIKTTSGDIELRDVDKASIKSTSGDINVQSGKKLDLSTTSGDVNVGEVITTNIKTTSGEIELDEVKSGGEFISTSGDIDIRTFFINENTNIETTSGEVDVRLANDAIINASTRSGDKDIKSSMGEYSLNVKTTSGDITIK